MPEGLLQNEQRAFDEARVIARVTAPIAKGVIKEAARSGSDLERALPQLGDPFYLELGSQILTQIEEEQPELYGALIEREKHFGDLVEATYHSYLDFGEERRHYIPRARRRLMAEKVANDEKAEAFESARGNGCYLVSRILRDMERLEKEGERKFRFLGLYNEKLDFVVATEAIKEEMKDSHLLKDDDTLAITALLGCALASRQVDRLFRIKPSLNLEPASQKQDTFYGNVRKQKEK